LLVASGGSRLGAPDPPGGRVALLRAKARSPRRSTACSSLRRTRGAARLSPPAKNGEVLPMTRRPEWRTL